ncbi:MAG TPA: DNA polymerase III subunit, partial [Dissulfurispiraceae bacterium]|nr:DNA polymerase III subunit [Dissulfurispiraceae bacterium]
GKFVAARAYAKALTCPSKSADNACDGCGSCRRFAAGTHPDVMTVTPDSGEIRIEAIRSVDEFLSMKALESPMKCVMVDDAHTMNASAANAFLKTLEEPPPRSVIILVTPNAESLPDTICSRCFRVRFSPLSAGQCCEVIAALRKEPVRELDNRLAMGRPGFAIGGNPSDDLRHCMEILDAMLRGDAKEAWSDRDSMEEWFDQSALIFRDLALSGIDGVEHFLPTHALTARNSKAVLDAWQTMQHVRVRTAFHLNKSITWHYIAEVMRNAVKA